MWSEFQQNRSKIVEVRDAHRQTDRQTQTHTHRQTHKQGSSWDNIFSPEMTEYKKRNNGNFDISFRLYLTHGFVDCGCRYSKDLWKTIEKIQSSKRTRKNVE